MRYPECLNSLCIHPLLGQQIQGDPFFIPITSENVALRTLDLMDQHKFQAYLDRTYGNDAWGISDYLEYRESLLGHLPQMSVNKRYYHLGLDIIVPAGTALHSPLEGRVRQSGYESGRGNYGGYVLQYFEGDFEPFYCLFGHLDINSLPMQNATLCAGEIFAHIGDYEENGNWFQHTHMQMLTQRAVDEGRVFQGYATKAELSVVPQLFPRPHTLFRY